MELCRNGLGFVTPNRVLSSGCSFAGTCEHQESTEAKGKIFKEDRAVTGELSPELGTEVGVR